MPAQWTGDLKRELHNSNITVKEIALEAKMNRRYVSQVLHADNPSERARDRLFDALERLKASR